MKINDKNLPFLNSEFESQILFICSRIASEITLLNSLCNGVPHFLR